jgi:hypothetical protein
MRLKSIFSILICVAVITSSCNKLVNTSVESPDQKVKALLTIASGKLQYGVFYNNKPVIQRSDLGIIFEDADFSKDLKFDSVSEIKTVDEKYSLLHGKKKNITYKANRRVYHLSNSAEFRMDVVFQVSNDGVGFCYQFPDSSENIKKVTSEITAFNFSDSTTAWIQPRAKAKSGWNQCNPSYEEHYLKGILLNTVSANDTGWVFPALFHSGNCWVNLTESWPDGNYCGSHLNKGQGANQMVIAFPELSEGITKGAVFPESKLPLTSPWRIITLGENPGIIVESTLGTDLAKPSVLDDISYVKPGRASWSWVLMKDPSVNYKVQKEFIDYAADMGWEYCLVDADWDTRIGWEKIAELSGYAAKKNVSLLLWYNSAGDWNTVPYHPRDLLLSTDSRCNEFSKLQAIGIKGIKVDFFGGDGQSMMDYYRDILFDANKYQLVVNFHGATYPRGLQRTYPNLVSIEAIRGLEYATFGQETADKVPSKATLLAFTRNAFDPMDFTPVCFNEYDMNKRVTGNGAELALAVLFLSGVQHYAEIPSGMAKVPDYVKNMMREIPVVWDETKFIDGYPGKYLIIARRSGVNWYVAGVNAEPEVKDIDVKLTFTTSKTGTLITEGDSLRSFSETMINLDSNNAFHVKLLSNGGFVFKIN